jgi:hypothetical protein
VQEGTKQTFKKVIQLVESNKASFEDINSTQRDLNYIVYAVGLLSLGSVNLSCELDKYKY